MSEVGEYVDRKFRFRCAQDFLDALRFLGQRAQSSSLGFGASLGKVRSVLDSLLQNSACRTK